VVTKTHTKSQLTYLICHTMFVQQLSVLVYRAFQFVYFDMNSIDGTVFTLLPFINNMCL